MKKYIYELLLLLAAAGCSKDALEFSPTDSGSGDKMLQAAKTAITSINGMYRSMWTAGWSTGGNTHQCFGIAAYNMAQDAMADDFIMQGQGNGWFWYDHIYNVKSFYTSDSWRSYDVWRAYYKWIADSNYVIDAGETMSGEEEDVAFVVGQAFAIRPSGSPARRTTPSRTNTAGAIPACRSTRPEPASRPAASPVPASRKCTNRSMTTWIRPSSSWTRA